MDCGQLVEAGLAEEAAHPGDAGVEARRDLEPVLEVGLEQLGVGAEAGLCVDAHRAELVDGDGAPVATHPLLLEEGGSRRGQLEGEGHERQQQDEQQGDRDGDDQIEGPLGEASGAALDAQFPGGRRRRSVVTLVEHDDPRFIRCRTGDESDRREPRISRSEPAMATGRDAPVRPRSSLFGPCLCGHFPPLSGRMQLRSWRTPVSGSIDDGPRCPLVNILAINRPDEHPM